MQVQTQTQTHNVVERPWGTYQTVDTVHELGFQVKRILVKPFSRLSLQYHNHRSEHWTLISGSLICQVGEDFHHLDRNQSIYVPKGVKHRMVNETNKDAILIEVQVGESVAEDDIVRLQDDYGRVN